MAGGDTPGDILESNGSGHDGKFTRDRVVRNRNAEVEQVADRTVHEGVGLLGERGVGSPELDPVEQTAPDARV